MKIETNGSNNASITGSWVKSAPKRTRPRKPTHKCKECGALWMKCSDGTWALISCRCGVCCDNAEMGEQMLPIKPTRTRPRKSRDRRLLEALLKCLGIFNDCQKIKCLCEKGTGVTIFGLKESEQQQLIAIKEAMTAKKGGGK